MGGVGWWIGGVGIGLGLCVMCVDALMMVFLGMGV